MSLAMGIAGRNLFPYRSGYGAAVAAEADCFGMVGGATIDWNLFSALGSNLTLADTELLLAGWRYARYGQVFTRVTLAAANILTIGGGATGGTLSISVTNTATGTSSTQTATPAFPATALQVKTALEALFNVGAGNVTVTGGGLGPYYITFGTSLGTTTVATVATGLTGGTPTSVFSTGGGGISRSFGPFDPSATDGRQNLNRGDVFILNRTRVMGGSLQLPFQDDMHYGECIVKGRVWGAKVLATSGTHSLAAGPTFTELEAVMPMLTRIYV